MRGQDRRSLRDSGGSFPDRGRLEPTLERPVARQARLERARWRCRRGMKELDVLLERFVRRALDRLDDGELEALEHLLAQPDQDILKWIASASAIPPPSIRGIVMLIRSQALGRP